MWKTGQILSSNGSLTCKLSAFEWSEGKETVTWIPMWFGKTSVAANSAVKCNDTHCWQTKGDLASIISWWKARSPDNVHLGSSWAIKTVEMLNRCVTLTSKRLKGDLLLHFLFTRHAIGFNLTSTIFFISINQGTEALRYHCPFFPGWLFQKGQENFA